jgi:Mg-chelatase subunit ChlD
VSPEVGELDEEAFERVMDDDPDAALALLADLTGATDERLRALARRLAGRVITDVARVGAPRRRGIGRMARERAARTPGDLDIDASLDAVLDARGARRPPNLDDLTVRSWHRPDTALCLLVDRSGSMLGERLAAAAVAAAAVAYRNAPDCSVVAFGDEAIVLKSQDVPRSADELVGDLLRLRGHGTTDVGLAVRTAGRQLSRSNAGRKVAVLLSDCRPTTGGDPTADAALLDELAIVAPAGDLVDAEALARAVGARCVALGGPAQVPEAIAAALLG